MGDLKQFKNKVRVRSCGLLQNHGKVLLLKHNKVGPNGYLWSPPGGGVEFGETCEETVIREFMEETGLKTEIKAFLFANEYIDQQIHAIEMFYHVVPVGGSLKLGGDPEMESEKQILEEARFFSMSEIKKLDVAVVHNAFHHIDHIDAIFEINGMIKFHNI